MEDNTIKLDLSKPAVQESPQNEPVETQAEVPAQEEPKVESPKNEAGDYVINLNKPADAVQERQTEEVPVPETPEASEAVVDEVQPLQLIEEDEVKEEKVEETAPPTQVLEPVTAEKEQQVIVKDTPEGIDKFVEFMNDTGLEGADAMQAYINLNKNPDEMDARSLLTEYYQATKPFLNTDQIQKQLNKKYQYDVESTDPDVIEEKNIALQEELYKAKQHFLGSKEKYYTDLKLRQQRSLSPEAQEAVEFYSEYKSNQEKAEQINAQVSSQIDQIFTDEFEGFDFKVGDKKYRYKVDSGKQKEVNKDLTKVFSNYFDENGSLTDAVGYNKALIAAQNVDQLVQHFYEQGRADAVQDAAKKAKNIDMGGREDASSIVTPGGQTVRVVSGDSKSQFKSKIKIPGWNN